MQIFRDENKTRLLDERHFPLWFWSESLRRTEQAAIGVVMSGPAILVCDGQRFELATGSYFSLNAGLTIEGGSGLLIFVPGFRPLATVGGPLENEGRLKYIDGCRDTLLIGPPKLGDPCLNALYFPPQTKQTLHTHPSVRIGAVMSGCGFCFDDDGERELRSGDMFIIAPDERHAFRTDDSQMTVIAFHPDSDFGPQDEIHPMINRTMVDGVSARHLDHIRTK